MSDRLPSMSDPSDPFEPERQSDPGGPSTSTTVLERDHGLTGQCALEDLLLAHVVREALVVALCGKVWVPGRDPKKFPVCPVCQEIYDGLRAPQDGKD